VIGCGGVKSGAEAFMHILAGASLVQMGTALYEEGPSIFARVKAELLTIMAQKGYGKLSDFHGKLKTL
jgi:dihydroorotate dehydrogenase (fumarate)